MSICCHKFSANLVISPIYVNIILKCSFCDLLIVVLFQATIQITNGCHFWPFALIVLEYFCTLQLLYSRDSHPNGFSATFDGEYMTEVNLSGIETLTSSTKTPKETWVSRLLAWMISQFPLHCLGKEILPPLLPSPAVIQIFVGSIML